MPPLSKAIDEEARETSPALVGVVVVRLVVADHREQALLLRDRW